MVAPSNDRFRKNYEVSFIVLSRVSLNEQTDLKKLFLFRNSFTWQFYSFNMFHALTCEDIYQYSEWHSRKAFTFKVRLVFIFNLLIIIDQQNPCTQSAISFYLINWKTKFYTKFYTQIFFLLSAIQTELPVIYVLIFQKLSYVSYQIKQPAPLPPIFVKIVEIIQKKTDFPVFCPMVCPPDLVTLLWH